MKCRAAWPAWQPVCQPQPQPQASQAVCWPANPFQCPTCGKVLSNRSSLAGHIRTHTGERPYHCPVCPSTFNDLSNLRRHRVVHTRAKRYECQERCRGPSRAASAGRR